MVPLFMVLICVAYRMVQLRNMKLEREIRNQR